MLISRAKELAGSWGLSLIESRPYDLELKRHGNYIDTLHQVQIGYLNEEDFINYYLRGEGDDPELDYDFEVFEYVNPLDTIDERTATAH